MGTFEKSKDILDIDEIDLTGDITTSSFGDFGPPTRLWRESSASRVEPVSKKKGKKRKSDEYQSDLFSPSSARSTSKRVNKATTYRSAGPFEGSQGRILEEYQDEERDSPTQKPRRTDVNEEMKEEEEFPDVGFEEDMEFYDAVDADIDRELMRTPLEDTHTRRARKVVPDSDEEDVDLVGIKIQSQRPIKNESMENYQQDIGLSPKRFEPTQHKLQLSQPDNFLKVSQSPSRTVLPTTIHPGLAGSFSPKRETTFKSSGSSIDHNKNLTEDQQRVVDSFIKSGLERCQGLLERLEQSNRSVRSAIMDAIISGDGASEQMQWTLKDIHSKITATTQLLEEHGLLKKLLDKQSELSRQRYELEASKQEIDFTDPTNAFMQVSNNIRRTKLDIDSHQSTVLKLLENSGVAMTSEPAPSASTNNPPLSPSTSLASKSVLVASTQKVPQHVSPRRKYDDAQDLAHLSTQSVRQTPVSQRITPVDNSFEPQSHRYAAPRSSPQRASVPVKPLQRPMSTRTIPNVPESPRRYKNTSYEDDDAYDRGFSRTMGSPPADFAFNDDDFGDDFDDDEEMYKAAEEFEQNLPMVRSTPPSLRGRMALGEVSENIRRRSPQKPTSRGDDSPHARLMQYPWSKDVASALKKRFHLQGFRHNQLEAINATLSGKDAFVLMPTGGGKSLCYQLPSIVQSGHTRGVTVVVSPLLSLMQDQVDHLNKLRIQAVLLNGDSSKEARSYLLTTLKGPHPERFVQLLYITPEMFNKSQAMVRALQDLHQRQRLARIVIDEAHCVSQWGHDFRPDYKALGELRKQFKNVPVMALTATATENVKVDVMQNLGMVHAERFTQSFNRPNLTYEVRPKGKGPAVLESIADLIQTSYSGQAGIVYCLSRKNCETVAEKLRQQYNINAQHYHAGMSSDERIDIQKKWQAGKFLVIVATIAFGMGIDKPDVRFVIHHTIPKSLEGYYQETGRAGRDGKKSGCYLYYGYGDTMSLKRMIDQSDGSDEQKLRQRHLLRNVVQFCDNRSDCRRKQVLNYFNEHFDPMDCQNGCDNCNSTSTFVTEDFSEHAQHIVRLVRKIHSANVTLLHSVDVYRGARLKKIVDLRHDQIEEFGMGSDLVRGDVERLFNRLIWEDAIGLSHQTNRSGFTTEYVQPGPNASVFEQGRRPLKIQVLASPRNKAQAQISKPRKTAKGNTGVAAAADTYPASTNVSSPMQSRPCRRAVARRQTSYSSDDDFIAQSSEEEDTIASRRAVKKAKADSRSAPITSDESISNLNEIHQYILEDFVERAKKDIERIVIAKSLRRKPITDQMLRDIAIHFSQTEQEIKKRTRLNDDMYKIFGPMLLRLITTAYNNYEAMIRAQEDPPEDPNHKTVVMISDDEIEGDDDFVENDVDVDESESSHYFSVADEVSQFNQRSKCPRNWNDRPHLTNHSDTDTNIRQGIKTCVEEV